VCDRLDLEVAGCFIEEVCGAVDLGVFVYFTRVEGDGFEVGEAIGLLVRDFEWLSLEVFVVFAGIDVLVLGLI